MSLPVKTEVQGVQEFFQHLSSPDFNSKIEIKTKLEHEVEDRVRVSPVVLYKVIETAKFHWLNPIRLVPVPNFLKTPVDNKIKLANNLLGMVKKHEKEIAKLTNLDVAITNLGKIAEKIVRNTEGTDTEKIQGKFNEVIAIVSKAQVQHFATNRGNFEQTQALRKINFYNQLANTGWFGKVGGFNERIHVKEPSPYKFEVYTSSKLSFTQKLLGQGKAVSGAEKIATAQNLGKMISADWELIRDKKLNVTGMVTNLQALKGRITRNTVPSQSAIIEKALDGAISDLNKLSALIAKDINNSWKGKLRNCLVNWIVLPVHNKTTGPAWRYTGGALINKAYDLKDGVARKFKQLNLLA